MPRQHEITRALRQRVVSGLHLGVLEIGTRLPGVRSTAAELGTDPRLVLAGYQQLASEGLVEMRPRSGVYVAAVGAALASLQPANWMVDLLTEVLERGIPATEFPERLARCLQTVRIRACCIECNDDQLTGLCEELRRDYGIETRPLNIEDLNKPASLRHLRTADLLVTTSFHSSQISETAKELKRPEIVVSLRPEFLGEMGRLTEKGPVWFIARDPRFEPKFNSMFSAIRATSRPRVLIAGRDDLDQIVPGEPTYITLEARKALKDLPRQTSLVPAPRVFSEHSSREILSFVVNKNLEFLAGESRRSRPSTEKLRRSLPKRS
ncbi:MAG: GntR family transcriptional regulator [Acidobacteria bacterium]|nr:GntR family transcriptional regulator [Acidobacteriota bacterium]